MRFIQKSDQELIKIYLTGDESALGMLIQRHQSQIFSFLMSKLKNKAIAEDLFQDVFVKVINTMKAGKYNEEGKFLPWVMRISHNIMIDHFRKSNKMKMVRAIKNGADESDEFDVLTNIKESSKRVDEEMEFTQIRGDLKKLIRLLPEDQKEVLIMRHYYKMSFKEISEMTNVSINTALGRMRYALMNLRKMISVKELNMHLG
jgi:RNA polymerase sigma-70 factor (ECF subfamily)